jgi:uncharacterized RmlC-like cupin family protein
MKSDKDKIDISAVEDHDGILTIRGGGARRDWNGIHYKQGMSGKNEAGDFIYIKPGVPHEVFNMSDTEPVVAFVARSSPDEWDNIIPYERNQSSSSSS